MVGGLSAEELCTLPPLPSVAPQTILSAGAPCAVLRSLAALKAARARLLSASSRPVFSPAEDSPLRLRPDRIQLTPTLGASPALLAEACAPGSAGTRLGRVASARLPDVFPASVPAAALAACADWRERLSWATGALVTRPASSAVAASAGSVPALLARGGSASIMALTTSVVRGGPPSDLHSPDTQHLVHKPATETAPTRGAVAWRHLASLNVLTRVHRV